MQVPQNTTEGAQYNKIALRQTHKVEEKKYLRFAGQEEEEDIIIQDQKSKDKGNIKYGVQERNWWKKVKRVG